MRLGLIINPSSGRNRGALVGAEVRVLLAQSEHEVIDLSGSTMAIAQENGERAISQGDIDALVLVGGDGMAYLGCNLCTGKNVPIAIVPAGTGNDSATLFGTALESTAQSVAMILANLGEPKAVDVIRVQHDGVESFSFGSASAGFDALVNARANRMSWPKGPNRYYAAMLLELASFRPIRYEIEIDGNQRVIEAMLCAVSNTGVFGGGMLIAPNASATDGELDLFVVKKMSRAKLVAIFPKVYKGTHITEPEVEIIRCKSVKIKANGMPIYSDGEYVGRAPFVATIEPAALMAIAPLL